MHKKILDLPTSILSHICTRTDSVSPLLFQTRLPFIPHLQVLILQSIGSLPPIPFSLFIKLCAFIAFLALELKFDLFMHWPGSFFFHFCVMCIGFWVGRGMIRRGVFFFFFIFLSCFDWLELWSFGYVVALLLLIGFIVLVDVKVLILCFCWKNHVLVRLWRRWWEFTASFVIHHIMFYYLICISPCAPFMLHHINMARLLVV